MTIVFFGFLEFLLRRRTIRCVVCSIRGCGEGRVVARTMYVPANPRAERGVPAVL